MVVMQIGPKPRSTARSWPWQDIQIGASLLSGNLNTFPSSRVRWIAVTLGATFISAHALFGVAARVALKALVSAVASIYRQAPACFWSTSQTTPQAAPAGCCVYAVREHPKALENSLGQWWLILIEKTPLSLGAPTSKRFTNIQPSCSRSRTKQSRPPS